MLKLAGADRLKWGHALSSYRKLCHEDTGMTTRQLIFLFIFYFYFFLPCSAVCSYVLVHGTCTASIIVHSVWDSHIEENRALSFVDPFFYSKSVYSCDTRLTLRLLNLQNMEKGKKQLQSKNTLAKIK